MSAIVYGTPLSATQLNAGANVDGAFEYTPAEGTLLDAGSHTLRVAFTPADSRNYEPATATASLTVLKAKPTFSGLDARAKYDGDPHGAPVQLSGVGDERLEPVVVTYDGGTALPVNAGTYAVAATFAGNTNYEAAGATGTVVIEKASPTIQVTNVSVIYDGLPHAAIGTVTGVRGAVLGPLSLTYNGSADVPVNAGTYAVSAFFAGDANYTQATQTSAVVAIARATPIVHVTGGVFVVDQAAHPATGVVTGVGGVVLGVPSFSYRRLPGGAASPNPPAAAGIYEVTAVYPATLNYNGASATGIIVINEPPAITAVTGTTAVVAPGTQVSVSATYSDPATGDAHTCTFAWGDGTVTTTGVIPPGAGVCQAVHTYATAGVYGVTVTVTDDDTLRAEAAFDSVIVSTRIGTISGGGTVQSPAGAFVGSPAGTANITLSVRYASGAAVPSGVTSFTFTTARLSFSASTYQWMVVVGGRAWYRGTGMVTINGQSSPAEFLVAAADGPNLTADSLRIRIWKASGVVYDNQPGAAQGATATPLMPSGPASIVVR